MARNHLDLWPGIGNWRPTEGDERVQKGVAWVSMSGGEEI
jgi:hypothetical protein